MDEVGPALRRAAEIVAAYREGLPDARVAPIAGRADVRAALGALPDGPTPLDDVLSELVETATPGLMASSGPRYFGFVIGGSLDAALVADVITSGWEQNAFNEALSPAGIAFEDVAGTWLKEILGLPDDGVRRVRHGSSGCEHGRSGRGPLARAERARLGRRPGRAPRRAADQSRRGRGAPRDDRPCRPPPRPRRELDRRRSGAARRSDGHHRAGSCPPRRRRADDRLRAGRERQHRGLRRPGARRGGGAIGRSVGPRRRCLRPLGRRQPSHPVTRGGYRARRLVGLRRAQVAQRPVRLGLRLLRASGGARDRDGVHRRLPHRPGRGS